MLAIFRLIRLPLLFTALADASVLAILANPAEDVPAALKAVWVATAGLYIFATAFNDIVDAKRDRAALAQKTAIRQNPIAADKLHPAGAMIIAVLGLVLATTASLSSPLVNPLMTAAAAVAITLYNVGLKRVPPLGLPLLGVIRAAWTALALVGPTTGHWWAVPTVIGFHTILISAFAYAWEGRKPALYGNNWFHLLVVISAIGAALSVAPAKLGVRFWPAGVSLSKVYITWAVFIAVFGTIFARTTKRQRGPVLRFFGTAWLIPLDFSFLLAAGRADEGVAFLVLLACLAISVQLMRVLARRVESTGR